MNTLKLVLIGFDLGIWLFVAYTAMGWLFR